MRVRQEERRAKLKPGASRIADELVALDDRYGAVWPAILRAWDWMPDDLDAIVEVGPPVPDPARCVEKVKRLTDRWARDVLRELCEGTGIELEDPGALNRRRQALGEGSSYRDLAGAMAREARRAALWLAQRELLSITPAHARAREILFRILTAACVVGDWPSVASTPFVENGPDIPTQQQIEDARHGETGQQAWTRLTRKLTSESVPEKRGMEEELRIIGSVRDTVKILETGNATGESRRRITSDDSERARKHLAIALGTAAVPVLAGLSARLRFARPYRWTADLIDAIVRSGKGRRTRHRAGR